MTNRGRRLVAWILGFGLLATAAVAGAGLFLDASTDDAAADDEAPEVPVPMIEPPSGTADAVPTERISVAASSFLVPDGEITYDPGNTVDGDPSTAWNSDTNGADVRGQTLTFRFTEPVGLTAIRLVNGYAKNPDIFAANHRIRELEVRTDGGVQRVSLLDTSEEQEITFDFGTTSKVELEVIEIYEGAGFDDPELTSDLALSEIDFVAIQRQS
ncbi:MAG: hypothetical protein AAGA93_22170 [Actinomycetota bacterium]